MSMLNNQYNIENSELNKNLSSNIPQPKEIHELLKDSLVSSKNFFLNNLTKKVSEDEDIYAYKANLKIMDEYKHILSNNLIKQSKIGHKSILTSENKISENSNNEKQFLNNKSNRVDPIFDKITSTALATKTNQIIKEETSRILNNIPEKYNLDINDQKNENLALSLFKNENQSLFRKNKNTQPEWHAPWKLYRVISGHTGWVRCIDVDPTNNWFVTGSNDRLIKFWDLASGKLKLSLTGHINTVRGVVVSNRHPYLFSCSEDKTVKCWDLEQNKVVRQYHGHLSGVHTIALHPSQDVIVTGGRDCVARVWDIRSRNQIFVLEGHSNTIASVVCQEFNPQIITGSHDSTIRLWDLKMGKCLTTLTHHKKSIRSLAVHDQDYTFISGGCDNIKVWQCPEGKFLRNLSGHNAIVNSVAINKDGIVASGADNGSLFLWDYKSGHNFQQLESKVQSGSLSAEAGIFAIKFDQSSTRMITAECDKTIKMWKEDDEATPETHPI